eukprot:1914499-Pyramimonas_sp.AAC.1
MAATRPLTSAAPGLPLLLLVAQLCGRIRLGLLVPGRPGGRRRRGWIRLVSLASGRPPLALVATDGVVHCTRPMASHKRGSPSMIKTGSPPFLARTPFSKLVLRLSLIHI